MLDISASSFTILSVFRDIDLRIQSQNIMNSFWDVDCRPALLPVFMMMMMME